ncbi:MrpH family fimbial adhesin [Serratia marcescens]|uniref:MrpH family fimbial adhesin n=1 Tax=Serratia marcescens TaxID=615 RepID=UPI0011AEFE06|nr:hypothetical protein [Serratia marcescens]
MQRQFFLLVFLFLLFGRASSAFAGISLNVKWVEDNRGLWSLSITPQGTFELDPSSSIAQCVNGGCEGQWRIYVFGGKNGGDSSIWCEPTVTASKGMTARAYATVVERAANGKTCTLSNLRIDGSEKICIMHQSLGDWRSEWTNYGGMRLFWTDNCDYGGGGGGPGGTIDPPIKPLNCTLSDISLTHGTIDYRQITESEATYSATVYCNRLATVKISVANDGKVNFKDDGSFYAIVSVMGKPGSAQLPVNGSTPVKFSSRLYMTGNNVIRGEFSGTAVAVLNVL